MYNVVKVSAVESSASYDYVSIYISSFCACQCSKCKKKTKNLVSVVGFKSHILQTLDLPDDGYIRKEEE